MALGAISRNHKGDTKSGTLDLVIAEASRALHVAEFCKDFGLQQIIMEGDELQILNAIKSNSKNWSRNGQIVEHTQGVLHAMSNWQIFHVTRGAILWSVN